MPMVIWLPLPLTLEEPEGREPEYWIFTIPENKMQSLQKIVYFSLIRPNGEWIHYYSKMNQMQHTKPIVKTNKH